MLCHNTKELCSLISTKLPDMSGNFFYFRFDGLTITMSIFESCIDIRFINYMKIGLLDIPIGYQNIQHSLESEDGKILKGYLDFIKFVKR